jgi:hypothetical protein
MTVASGRYPVLTPPGYHVVRSNNSFGLNNLMNLVYPVDYKAGLKVASLFIALFVACYVCKYHKHLIGFQSAEDIEKKTNELIDSCVDNISDHLDGGDVQLPKTIMGKIKKGIADRAKYAVRVTCRSAVRYVYDHPISFAGIFVIPTVGYFAGFPMLSGGLAAGNGLIGSIISVRQEMAAMREENRLLHEKTQQQLVDMEKNNQARHQEAQSKLDNVDKNNQELHQATQENIDKVSGEIKTVQSQIEEVKIQLLEDSKNNQDSHKATHEKITKATQEIEKLSGQLHQATERMVELHSNRDEKDTQLYDILEKATQELAGAKDSLKELVESLIQQSEIKREQQLKIIQEQYNTLDINNKGQIIILKEVQDKIASLLDVQEKDQESMQSLIQSIQLSNTTVLDELENKQNSFEKKLVEILEKNQKECKALVKNVEQEQGQCKEQLFVLVQNCSSLSGKLSKLEAKVEENHQNTQQQFLQVNNKIDSNHVEVQHQISGITLEQQKNNKILQELVNQNAILLKRLSLAEEKLSLIDDIKKSQDKNSEKLDELVGFTKQYSQDQNQHRPILNQQRKNLSLQDAAPSTRELTELLMLQNQKYS